MVGLERIIGTTSLLKTKSMELEEAKRLTSYAQQALLHNYGEQEKAELDRQEKMEVLTRQHLITARIAHLGVVLQKRQESLTAGRLLTAGRQGKWVSKRWWYPGRT